MLLDQFLITKQLKKVSEDRASETPLRSVIKSISWRCIGTIDTIVISWIITGEVSMALTIGSIELETKMVLYFLTSLSDIILTGKKGR